MPDAPTATHLLRDGFVLLGSALAFVLLFWRLGLGATLGLQIETGDVRAARPRATGSSSRPSARGGRAKGRSARWSPLPLRGGV